MLGVEVSDAPGSKVQVAGLRTVWDPNWGTVAPAVPFV